MDLNAAFSYFRIYRRKLMVNNVVFTNVVKRSIHILLTIICLCSIRYYLYMYLEDRKTIITTAEFYGEHHQKPQSATLLLPRFTFCFSKVFTYGRNSISDIKLMYGAEHLLFNYTAYNRSLPNYAWKLEIEDVIKQVKFQSKVEHLNDVFESVFYLPSLSCWRTKEAYKVFASQAGRVNTLELVINAGVYDDIMVNYESPVVYMIIVPFGEVENQNVAVGNLGNAIAISPGTYSSVGFHVTKINSRYRNRNDARVCDDTGLTQDICRANHNKKMILHTCGLNVNSVKSSASHFYLCGVRPKQTDSASCQVEPCVGEVYTFTKSEGYIKFDKRMSVLNISTSELYNISNSLAKAMQLDSQHNPWRRFSFINLASGIDFVTNSISRLLQKPTGFACTAIKNLSATMVQVEEDKIPNVILEEAQLTIIKFRFIKQCNNIRQYLAHNLQMYVKHHPCFQHFIPQKLFYALKNSQLHQNRLENETKQCGVKGKCKNYNKVMMQTDLRNFGDVVNTILTSCTELKSLSVKMGTVYRKLRFTKFIKTFSAFTDGNDYTELLKQVLVKLQTVSRNLFEGTRQRSDVFSHDNDEYSLELRSLKQCTVGPKHATRSQIPTSFRQIWNARNWLASHDPGWCSYRNPSIPFSDVAISGSPVVEKIPDAVELFCQFYVGYLAIGERHFNTEISYSLGSINSRFSVPPDYALYVIGSILTTYDTANLFRVGSEGLNEAEQRSCARLSGVNSHARDRSNVLYAVRKQYTIERCHYGHCNSAEKQMIPASRAERLITFLVDYINSFTSYEEAANMFSDYYKQHISKSFKSMFDEVKMLRRVIIYHEKLMTKNTRHKIFLIGRLKKLSNLVRDAIAGSGEKYISEFLSKKGTILVGEIRIELAELHAEYETNKAIYKHTNNIIQSIEGKRSRNNTIADSMFAAILSSVIHRDENRQQEIIRVLKWCNDQKWKQSKAKYDEAIRIFPIWLRNVTAMVQRAKRYTDSLVLSKAFMRKNMMKVSLYYDSLQVLTKTSERAFSADQLYASISNVASIYWRISLLNLLQPFIIVMCFPAYVVKQINRYRKERHINKVNIMPLSESENTLHMHNDIAAK